MGDARARARDRQERVRGIAQWYDGIFGEWMVGILAVLKRFGEVSRGKRKKESEDVTASQGWLEQQQQQQQQQVRKAGANVGL